MVSAAMRRSIRGQLLVILLGSVALAWVATTIVSYLDARHELGELLDAHLAQSTSLLVSQLSHESDEIDIEHSPRLHPYALGVAFQFWEDGTKLRLHSANAPNSRLSPKTEGFDNADIEGTRWRVFSAWDSERHYLVQVGERLDARDQIVAEIAKNMLWPLLVALPALGVLVWLGIHRATRPLRLLNRQLEYRAPDNLASLDVRDAPAEVSPLVTSLNRLFDRARSSIENERRFTADAAHELRTPLAGVRAQAQVARSATDDTERARALDNVIFGCDRASHLVDQLLTLARLEPETFRAESQRCDLREIARAAIAEVVPSAIGKKIEIEFAGDPVAEVQGDARLLRILLRNLLDNAVRYSPGDTVVRVHVGERDGVVFVSVADQGPGVGPVERKRLGQRFHRVLGTEASGTGLGLSIAKRIAQIHGAMISFDEAMPDKGLIVTLSFTAPGGS